MNAKVLNFGSINIDYVYRVSHFVQPGETLSSDSLTTVLGGKGANQSVALANAGCPVAHIGQIGVADHWCISELKSLGVDTHYIQSIDGSSGHAIIQVDDDGENAIVLHGGANQRLQLDQLEAAIKTHSSARYLLLQNEVNDVLGAVNLALKHQLKVVMNPAPMDPSIKALPLDSLDTLIVNQGEAFQLSGIHSLDATLQFFREAWPRTRVIVTCGADGAILQSDAGRLRVPSPQVSVVDTTAAGDTFVGYFLAGMVNQVADEKNLNQACRAAALATTKAGAIPSIPLAADIH